MFQDEMAKLQRLGVQLNDIAEQADDATRGRCSPEHLKLTDCAYVIDQKAPKCQQAVFSHIDSWHKFDKEFIEVCHVINEVEGKLPESVNMTDDVAVLRQQLIDCHDANDQLKSSMPHISDVMKQGLLILDNINSPHMQSQLSSLDDRVQSLTETVNTSMQWYFSALIWHCLEYEIFVTF